MDHLLWNEAAQRRHKTRNLAQSVLLLSAMAALLSACGWALAGGEGVVWSLMAGGLTLAFSPRIPPALILRLHRAQRIAPWQLPQVHSILAEVCAAADLARVPALYYVPSPAMNAFSLGNGGEAAVAVTDGMLRGLDLSEMAGILAHEVSHLRNGDLRLMGLADAISRLTRVMSLLGILLLIFSLPALASRNVDFPWLLAALLVAAPTLVALMQLALSRTREFDADLDAAGLTGDPAALASALRKVDRNQRNIWSALFAPARHGDEPSLLRTHPAIGERIKRLLSLQLPVRIPTGRIPIVVPQELAPMRRQPWRWR